jgi:uncharacterized peroxidase-related enzyme
MPFIDVTTPAHATGELQAIYERVIKKRGSVANVHAVQSVLPHTIEPQVDFYLSLMFGPSDLTRRERETVAVAVSHANACHYCITHHADALAKHQPDAALVSEMRARGTSSRLSPREAVLVAHAVKLTKSPQAVGKEDVEKLKNEGLRDPEILTLTMVTAYFNFINRVVVGLGVELEPRARPT